MLLLKLAAFAGLIAIWRCFVEIRFTALEVLYFLFAFGAALSVYVVSGSPALFEQPGTWLGLLAVSARAHRLVLRRDRRHGAARDHDGVAAAGVAGGATKAALGSVRDLGHGLRRNPHAAMGDRPRLVRGVRAPRRQASTSAARNPALAALNR
jgi:hypothetical protein